MPFIQCSSEIVRSRSHGGMPSFRTRPYNRLTSLVGHLEVRSFCRGLAKVGRRSITAKIACPRQGTTNYASQRQNKEVINNYEIKIDHKLSSKNQLSSRFSTQAL